MALHLFNRNNGMLLHMESNVLDFEYFSNTLRLKGFARMQESVLLVFFFCFIPNDSVAYWILNSFATIVLYLACLKSGDKEAKQ